MRHIKTILTAVFSGALLFTACTKSEQYNVAPSQAATPASPSKPIQTANTNFTPLDPTTSASPVQSANNQGLSNVNVQLMPQASSPNSPMKWNSGYLSVGAVTLDAIHVAGNALFKVSYGTKLQQVASINGPTALGGFSVPGGLYNNLVFSLTLTPLTAQNIMQLDGVYTSNTAQMPVQLVVNDALQLPSAILPNDMLIRSNVSYAAIMYLNMDQVLNGIDQNMLQNASKVNGTVVLSSTMNQNLYNMVLNNLRSALTVQFTNIAL